MIISYIMCMEIAIAFILILPIASPARWNRLFRAQFLSSIGQQAHTYFILMLGILALFLMEAVREIYLYLIHENSSEVHAAITQFLHVRVFKFFGVSDSTISCFNNNASLTNGTIRSIDSASAKCQFGRPRIVDQSDE